jgi:hypothetical protein
MKLPPKPIEEDGEIYHHPILRTNTYKDPEDKDERDI